MSRPVFYKGEQIGERRHYDERLTMFLLRYRDPVRYGAWIDQCESRRHPEGAALTLAASLIRVDQEAFLAEKGKPPRPLPPFVSVRHVTEADLEEEAEEARERADQVRRDREWEAYLKSRGSGSAGGDSDADVV